MNTKRFPIILFFACFTIFQVQSAEVDQFTQHDAYLDDSLSYINNIANRSLQKAIKKANKKTSSCQESALYEEMHTYFENHINGKIIIDLKHDKNLNKLVFAPKQSIYREWTIWDGFILGRPGAAKSELAMAPVFRMGEHRIGLDKLEHIFAIGFDYYKNHYQQGVALEKVLLNGIWWEKLLYGGKKWGTGVFSYADLAANFNGMRFWNDILKKYPDIMGKDIEPYVTCQGGKWKHNNPIDLSHYIDSSLNENINCSKFTTKETANKVKKQLEKMGLSCPLKPEKLHQLDKKYGHYAPFLLNYDGIEASESTEKWRERLGFETGWSRVPKKYTDILNYPNGKLYYRQESNFIRTFRLERNLSTRRNAPRDLVISWKELSFKEDVSKEKKKCWYIFMTGGECDRSVLSPLPSHYTEKGSLDLLSYMRDVSRINGLVKAREVLIEKLPQKDASKGEMAERVINTTADKEKVYKDSFSQIPQNERSSIGVYFTLGIGGADSPNAALMQEAAEEMQDMGFTSEMLPVSPVLGSAHNAKLLNKMLKERLAKVDKVILVTASKGAADFIHYFFNYGDKLKKEQRQKIEIVATFSGVVRSSFLAEYLSKSQEPTALTVRGLMHLSGQSDMLGGVKSLAQNPWEGHERTKIKKLFPNMTWISFASIPEDPSGISELSLWPKALTIPPYQWNKMASPSDGLVETAASILPPDTGIKQIIIPIYGPHAMALGSYENGLSVAPQAQGKNRQNINPSAGPEILDAVFRAFPQKLIE